MSLLKNKKILITGGKGFLAKHLIEKLKQYEINNKDIFISDFPEYDLRKEEDCLRAVRGVDIVIHLAGILGGVEFSKQHPGKIFYNNALMSLNIIEASRKGKVEKFIGIGSAYEYPKDILAPFKEENLWDGYPRKAKASYSLSKRFMLVQSQAYRREYNLNAIHLLMSNLYGPGDNFDHKDAHVIPSLKKKIIKAKLNKENYINVCGAGEEVLDFLYAQDAARGIILATEKYNGIEPVNIGTGKGISIKSLVKLLCKLINYNGEVRWGVQIINEPLCRTLDMSRSKKEFGFKSKMSLENGLKETIKWYLKNNKN